MNKNVSVEYANAYSEVLAVLNYMSKDDYDKIPKNMIEMFQANCNNEHQFVYDLNKEFADQEISKRGKLILAILFRDYWATPAQKKKIITKQSCDRQRLEQQKEKKYPAENLFKKNIDLKGKEQIEIKNIDNILMVEKQENIFKRIINKIKRFFIKV